MSKYSCIASIVVGIITTVLAVVSVIDWNSVDTQHSLLYTLIVLGLINVMVGAICLNYPSISKKVMTLLWFVTVCVVAVRFGVMDSIQEPSWASLSADDQTVVNICMLTLAVVTLFICFYNKRNDTASSTASFDTDDQYDQYDSNFCTNPSIIDLYRDVPHKTLAPSLENATNLRECYENQCKFPSWCINPDLFKEFEWNDTVVYIPDNAPLNDISKLVYRREPTNIANPIKKEYDPERLYEYFGYERGVYTADKPNIAIYCHAHVVPTTPSKRDSTPSLDDLIKVKVLNLIGLALDSPTQPDYQKYIDSEGKIIDINDVVEFYKTMWSHVRQCVKDHPEIKIVKIYNVGGGAFAGPLKRTFVTSVFVPAFKETKAYLEDNGIEIQGDNMVYDQYGNENLEGGGFIPNVLNQYTQADLDEILFINAWDPWSIIGNGNFFDPSLDGFWGRCSNMSVLGWTGTNPHMTYQVSKE